MCSGEKGNMQAASLTYVCKKFQGDALQAEEGMHVDDPATVATC